jgi:hypothetical protein
MTGESEEQNEPSRVTNEENIAPAVAVDGPTVPGAFGMFGPAKPTPGDVNLTIVKGDLTLSGNEPTAKVEMPFRQSAQDTVPRSVISTSFNVGFDSGPTGPMTLREQTDLVSRLERAERELANLRTEITSHKAEMSGLAVRNRFGPGGNNPPEPIDIEEATETIRVGATAVRLLRQEIQSPTPSVDVLDVCHSALKQAWRVIVRMAKWFGGKGDKFTDALVTSAGTSLGSAVKPAALLLLLHQLGVNLPDLIRDLEPLLRALGLAH